MEIFNYNTAKAKFGEDSLRSAQDFGRFFGTKPHHLGLAASLFSSNSTSTLLDSLMNIQSLPRTVSKFKPINDLQFRWSNNINKVKQVRITRNVTTNGQYGSFVSIYLEENYFSPYDVFAIEGSRDLLFVSGYPQKIAGNEWLYTCKVVTPNLETGLNTAYATANNFTRYRYNNHPEGSDMGFSRQESNVAEYNNYMSLIRHDEGATGQYLLQENQYIITAAGGTKDTPKRVFYKLDPFEKGIYQKFYESRATSTLFSKRTVDKYGKVLLQDERGRDIVAGDGLVTQIERSGDKFVYSTFTERLCEEIINVLRHKAVEVTGNDFLLVCNTQFENDFNRAMKDTLLRSSIIDTAFYSKVNEQKTSLNVLKVGATYRTYEFVGNTLTIKVDRALTQEYPDRGYAIGLNMSFDKETNMPAMEMFTLDGADVVTGTLKGLGGLDGKTSGDMSSPIHGVKHAIAGYSGVGVFCPYRHVIVEQNVITY